MIRSMTGYGRKEVRSGAGHFTVETRSVNNRYIDVQIKTPRALAVLEPRLRKSVQERFSRGRFDVFVSRNGGEEGADGLVLDKDKAEQYIGALRQLKNLFSLPGDVDLALVAGVPDIIRAADVQEDMETLWAELSRGLSQALDDLDAMRTTEGVVLARDILARLDAIEKLMDRIGARSPLTVEHARKRMEEALRKLVSEPLDQARLAQEIAIIAERTDITEELTRLGSHLKQFRTLMTGSVGEPVGRKLDFLLQEMGREVNTIASKAMDAEISFDAVTIKAELEKIREQVQNIE